MLLLEGDAFAEVLLDFLIGVEGTDGAGESEASRFISLKRT